MTAFIGGHDNRSPMRVLITGAAGFAGRHLAELCIAAGHEVTGAGRRPAERADPPAGLSRYAAADLGDPEQARALVAAARPAWIFHLAAEASVARSWEHPEETLAANLRSTENLLAAVRAEATEAAVVLASSGELYGPVPPERLPVTESEPLRPQNPYALSKACADLAAGFHADAHGLRVIRARAFNHAGPGQTPTYVVSSFARQIAMAEAAGGNGRVEIVTGNLEARRDITDVRDVVAAYALLAERAEPGVYNVGSGRSVPMADILAALAGLTPLAVEQRTDPDLLRPNDLMDMRASTSKLAAATGWEPRIPLERTLRDTLDWWRARVAS
jgi:GDP-4-dehydro-6-deoxy-D-mannose reductase